MTDHIEIILDVFGNEPRSAKVQKNETLEALIREILWAFPGLEDETLTIQSLLLKGFQFGIDDQPVENNEAIDHRLVDWDAVREMVPISGLTRAELLETLKALEERIPMKEIAQEDEKFGDVDFKKVDWKAVSELIPIGGLNQTELLEIIQALGEPVPMKENAG